MREIKFRAWVINSKKIVDLKKITPLACEPGLLEYGDGLFIPFRSDIILMQFTGLKDKNGKEIYEGDVLDYGLDRSFYIAFVDGAFVATFNNGVVITMISINQYQVIGNIYENPELLKP
jgi:uncharacterized phage protein (TIGR01671 family)